MAQTRYFCSFFLPIKYFFSSVDTLITLYNTSFDIRCYESRGHIDIQMVQSTDPVVGNSELPACQTEMEQQMELLNKNTVDQNTALR